MNTGGVGGAMTCDASARERGGGAGALTWRRKADDLGGAVLKRLRCWAWIKGGLGDMLD